MQENVNRNENKSDNSQNILYFIRHDRQWADEKREINKLCAKIHNEIFSEFLIYQEN